MSCQKPKTQKSLLVVLLAIVPPLLWPNIPALAQTNSVTNAVVPARSFLGIGGITTTPERKASPHFSGKELPAPPAQKSPWRAPDSSLPTNYVSATEVLFNQGLADPRGCDYREIEVGTGNVWNGDGGVVKTHGWVFGATNGQKFAICWNGLVYPTVSVGPQADWRADASDCMKKAGRQWRTALPEAYEVSYESCLPVKGCLLLRLGEPELARDLWLQVAAQRDLNAMFRQGSATNAVEEPARELAKEDPYLQWAGDWTWDLFERAVCAHMRGDDGLALSSAKTLAAARPQIESEAERRGFKRQQTYASPWDGKYQDYLNFLGPLSSLLADQERREQGHQASQTSANIEKITDQAKRIAAWIDALDQVAVRQSGQPGGLNSWEADPVVAGLLKEGQPAIEPLLECLNSDCGNRLTRSVSFWRDFSRDRMLHPVSQPIVSVLLKLMNASDAAIGFDRSSLYWGKISNAVLVAKFRSYWKEFGQLPPAERWYRKLADDNVGQRAWGDALANIVAAERASGDTNKTHLAGEVLRTKTSPTLTELLLQRCDSIVQSTPADPFATGDAVGFLLNTEKWEAPRGLLQTAAQLQDKVMAGYSGTHNIGSADPQNATSIAALAMLRARHGDNKGLNEYAAWIQEANPNTLEDSALDALEPFWRFSKNPALRAAASGMFAKTNSPWGTLAWCLDGGGFLRWRKPLASPALIIPEFRTLVLNELTNHDVAGEAINRGGGNLEVDYANGGKVNYGARKDTEGLEVGAKFVFRRCDVVVEQLAAIPGFPSTSILWPESKRDEAVAATIKLLATSGERLKAKEKPAHWSSAFDAPLIELSK